jgi:hypothetical protein
MADSDLLPEVSSVGIPVEIAVTDESDHALTVQYTGAPAFRLQDTCPTKGFYPVQDGETRETEPPGQLCCRVAVLENLVYKPHLLLAINARQPRDEAVWPPWVVWIEPYIHFSHWFSVA